MHHLPSTAYLKVYDGTFSLNFSMVLEQRGCPFECWLYGLTYPNAIRACNRILVLSID